MSTLIAVGGADARLDQYPAPLAFGDPAGEAEPLAGCDVMMVPNSQLDCHPVPFLRQNSFRHGFIEERPDHAAVQDPGIALPIGSGDPIRLHSATSAVAKRQAEPVGMVRSADDAPVLWAGQKFFC